MEPTHSVAGTGTAPPLYHVSAQALTPGQSLHSYAINADYAPLIGLAREALRDGPDAVRHLLAGATFDRLRDQGEYRVEFVLLEAAFEHARLRSAPQLPSRLAAVYVWSTLDLARRFRATYRPDGIIHRCTLVAGTAIERDGALIAAGIDLARPLAEQLTLVAHRADRYWQACEPMRLPETLVHGTVIIESVVADGEITG